MILLVDIGNSRIKWAEGRDGVLGPQSAAAYSDWSEAEWRSTLFGARKFERVIAACVAGEPAKRALQQATQQAVGRPVEFVESQAEAAGVRNAYPDPRQLGVDRWLAVVAAHHLVAEPACVIDVGTAMTIDVVTAGGEHLGGTIVPGPDLMVGSLMKGTSELAERSSAGGGQGARVFSDNTRDAILNGCPLALAALVERSHAELGQQAGTAPALLATGGALPKILPFLRIPVREIPDLVLRGLLICRGSP